MITLYLFCSLFIIHLDFLLLNCTTYPSFLTILLLSPHLTFPYAMNTWGIRWDGGCAKFTYLSSVSCTHGPQNTRFLPLTLSILHDIHDLNIQPKTIKFAPCF